MRPFPNESQLSPYKLPPSRLQSRRRITPVLRARRLVYEPVATPDTCLPNRSTLVNAGKRGSRGLVSPNKLGKQVNRFRAGQGAR